MHYLQSDRFTLKALLLYRGIVIPEILLFEAARENFAARRLKKWMSQRANGFGLALAFLSTMGGIRDGDETLGPSELQKMIISMPSEDVQSIDWAKLEDTIRERSESDSFVLAFAIMQLLWMGIQTISRWAEQLPISPLEIVTCAHAVCAIPIYILWWSKPLNVNEPIDLAINHRGPRTMFGGPEVVEISNPEPARSQVEKDRDEILIATFALHDLQDGTSRDSQAVIRIRASILSWLS